MPFIYAKVYFHGFLEKQHVVALSIAEVGYMASAYSATQALCLRRMFDFLRHEQVSSTKIYYDSKSAIELLKNLVFHGRNKHIDIKFHLICKLDQDQKIAINYCNSEDQMVDILQNH